MAGNSFGELFRVTTFGESHGAAIGVVIDGVPPNIPITVQDIQAELDRRKPGQSAITSPRQEKDSVEILAGLFEGRTSGTPLAMIIPNQDSHSDDYAPIKDLFRPGHADYTIFKKFGMRDHRGGGRTSGRETACRVAAGAVAKKILSLENVKVYGYTLAVGNIYAKIIDFSVIEKNLVRAPDLDAAQLMIQEIENVRSQGDSIGGIVEIVVQGCPPGLGDPVFDKLNARLAHAVMSVGAIKGFEIGEGFNVSKLKGSQNNDLSSRRDQNSKLKQTIVAGSLVACQPAMILSYALASNRLHPSLKNNKR